VCVSYPGLSGLICANTIAVEQFGQAMRCSAIGGVGCIASICFSAAKGGSTTLSAIDAKRGLLSMILKCTTTYRAESSLN
jgi:hypothetical protein